MGIFLAMRLLRCIKVTTEQLKNQMEDERIIVRSAIPADVVFADQIIHEMESSAIARGSGISKRSAAS